MSDLDTDIDLTRSDVVSFSTFLDVFKDTCTSLVNTGLDESVISMAVGEIHEEFVLEILKKVRGNGSRYTGGDVQKGERKRV